MIWSSYIFLLVFILNFFVGFFVLLKGKNRIVNRLIALLAIFTGFWNLSWSIFVSTGSVLWLKIVWLFGGFAPQSFALFTICLYKDKIIKSFKFIAFLLFLPQFFILFFIPTDLIAQKVISIYPLGHDSIMGDKVPSIFRLYWMGLLMFGLFKLAFLYRKTKGLKKLNLKYIFIGSLFYSIVSILSNMVLPLIGTVEYTGVGPISSLVWVTFLSYAIVKYRLMDISIAITRTTIFVSVYTIILGIPFVIAFGLKSILLEIFGSIWWAVPLVISTLSASAGPFVYLYFQKRAEDRLFKEQRQYQDTLRRASLGMGRIKDLKRLLTLIVYIVTRAVRIENCEIFLFDSNNEEYSCRASNRGTEKIGTGPKSGSAPIFQLNSPLILYLLEKKVPIVYEEIKQQSQDYKDNNLVEIESAFSSLNAAVIIPSFIENRMIGFLVLGEKKNLKLYNQDDLTVFSILANQSALAIENAQFYEDMKKKHEQLFKAEKMATIGTMADGLSHQINNRFHAMGFIAGDALDTIKLCEQTLIDSDKELFEEVRHALSRVEENVKKGGEIVDGLLKYTRKSESGFGDCDLEKILNASIEMIKYKVKLDNLEIKKNFSGNLPRIWGNLPRLQEVFFNVLDNAYDAIVEKNAGLKEKINGVIEITTTTSNDHVEIVFKDNGIGVKKENLKKIFTPFFTTKFVSKKGTGLGLYILHQIIVEHHGGKVDFTSEYQEGTVVRITFPKKETALKLT